METLHIYVSRCLNAVAAEPEDAESFSLPRSLPRGCSIAFSSVALLKINPMERDTFNILFAGTMLFLTRVTQDYALSHMTVGGSSRSISRNMFTILSFAPSGREKGTDSVFWNV